LREEITPLEKLFKYAPSEYDYFFIEKCPHTSFPLVKLHSLLGYHLLNLGIIQLLLRFHRQDCETFYDSKTLQQVRLKLCLTQDAQLGQVKGAW
jgi:cytochrome b561